MGACCKKEQFLTLIHCRDCKISMFPSGVMGWAHKGRLFGLYCIKPPSIGLSNAQVSVYNSHPTVMAPQPPPTQGPLQHYGRVAYEVCDHSGLTAIVEC
jgi:hypothetical protein